MDEWDVPLEETGEFDHQNGEGTSSADAGWKDELNLAEFPIAALTDRVPDGQTTLVFEDQLERRDSAPIVRRLTIMGTHKHGLPTVAGRRGPGRPDPVDQAAEQLHRRPGAVLAVRADRAAGLAAERAELPADRGGVAPLGRRGPDVRERLVGQRRQELGRRAVPRAGQRDALRPRAVADLGAVGAVGQGGPGREARQAPPAPVELPLERGDLPELPERQPQAARPGVLPEAAAADDQADVPVPGQAVLPPVAAGLRPAVAGLRAHRAEPVVRADGAEAAAQAGAGGAGAARVPRAAGPGGAVLVRQAGLLADHLHPRRPGDGRGAGPRRARGATARRADRRPEGAGRHGPDGAGAGRGAPGRPGSAPRSRSSTGC